MGATAADFIFAAVANELGLLGAIGIILCYLVFTWRGFHIAVYAPDGFSKLLAAGLTAAFALQTFIIIGGVTRLIPLTGITLPFVSYGGELRCSPTSCWWRCCSWCRTAPT